MSLKQNPFFFAGFPFKTQVMVVLSITSHTIFWLSGNNGTKVSHKTNK